MSNAAEIIDEASLVDEALANFTVLLEDFDLASVLGLLGVGRFQFLRRRQVATELRGLYIALWRLALARSFPKYADDMLTIFLRRYVRSHGEKIGAEVCEKAQQYWSMILPHGDQDFNTVAAHLCSQLSKERKEDRALILRLALHIRSAYKLIFARLI